MANIANELAAIMAAVFGRDVRQSIYDAIDKINKASEKAIDSGTAVNAGDPIGGYYEGSLYINTATNKLLRCGSANWSVIGDIRGVGISSITGPTTSGLVDTYTINYTDGVQTTFMVTNGRNGSDGNKWFCGVLVSGSSASPVGFMLPFDVKTGDMYLNINEDAIYTCTAGATAGVTSSWSYQFTITSSSTGTNDYNMLINQPSINGVTVEGALTGADLDLQSELVQGNGILIDTSTNTISVEFGSTATTAAAGNHTHSISLTKLLDSETVDISLDTDSKYGLTAGGQTVKFGSVKADKWHKVSGLIEEQTVTTIDTNSTITFTYLDEDKCYELWHDTDSDPSLASNPRRGEEPIIVSKSISGSGTSCTMTYVVRVPVNPTVFRLLEKANL